VGVKQQSFTKLYIKTDKVMQELYEGGIKGMD